MTQGEAPYSERTEYAYYTVGGSANTHTCIGAGIYNIWGSRYNYIQFNGYSPDNPAWDNQSGAINLFPDITDTSSIVPSTYNNIIFKQCFISSWAANKNIGSGQSYRKNIYFTNLLTIGSNADPWEPSSPPGQINWLQAFYLTNSNAYINNSTWTDDNWDQQS